MLFWKLKKFYGEILFNRPYKCLSMSYGPHQSHIDPSHTHTHILNNHRNNCSVGNDVRVLCNNKLGSILSFLHLQQNITHYLTKSVNSQFVLKLTILNVHSGKCAWIKKVGKIKQDNFDLLINFIFRPIRVFSMDGKNSSSNILSLYKH